MKRFEYWIPAGYKPVLRAEGQLHLYPDEKVASDYVVANPIPSPYVFQGVRGKPRERRVMPFEFLVHASMIGVGQEAARKNVLDQLERIIESCIVEAEGVPIENLVVVVTHRHGSDNNGMITVAYNDEMDSMGAVDYQCGTFGVTVLSGSDGFELVLQPDLIVDSETVNHLTGPVKIAEHPRWKEPDA